MSADDVEERVVIGQLVTNTAFGDIEYGIAIGGGSAPSLIRELDGSAKVTLVEDYATARAIASGTPAGELLAEGRIKIRGDANVLISTYERLSALSSALGSLADSTQF